ncbi:hypothetical protein AWZ03_004481 [Drosophila navojoa]|uniref:Uncharacterized protein n=1 Tax=Drosophila navojoa TaxID=7232 RepID=A0A484BN74_DRONA|nr:hypothetical protein AWZ03_004481 [Drosophila navojoa]
MMRKEPTAAAPAAEAAAAPAAVATAVIKCAQFHFMVSGSAGGGADSAGSRQQAAGSAGICLSAKTR